MQDSQQPGGAAPPPPQPPVASQSPNRTIMLILSYLFILALIPLLVEKDDGEIQWHAKHGLVLTAAWIVLAILLMVFSSLPVLGWILGCFLAPLIWLVVLVIHIICIVKALGGEKFRLPVLSDFADQWK